MVPPIHTVPRAATRDIASKTACDSVATLRNCQWPCSRSKVQLQLQDFLVAIHNHTHTTLTLVTYNHPLVRMAYMYVSYTQESYLLVMSSYTHPTTNHPHHPQPHLSPTHPTTHPHTCTPTHTPIYNLTNRIQTILFHGFGSATCPPLPPGCPTLGQ